MSLTLYVSGFVAVRQSPHVATDGGAGGGRLIAVRVVVYMNVMILSMFVQAVILPKK